MANSDIEGRYQVIHGPSREDLFDALRLCHERRNAQAQYIKNGHKHYIGIVVYMLRHEGAEGTRWLGEGVSHTDVSFLFDTRSRRGWIKFLK
jgi:hypothetical protein